MEKSPALWIYFALLCIKTVAITTLIAWHIFLKYSGLTTYQYLMKKEIIEKLKSQKKSGEIDPH